jgi:hypothetical protein
MAYQSGNIHHGLPRPTMLKRAVTANILIASKPAGPLSVEWIDRSIAPSALVDQVRSCHLHWYFKCK